MSAGRVEVLADRQLWSGRIALLVLQRGADGAAAIGRNVTMERVEPNAHTEPTLSLDGQAAQQLMDELWRCGLRPTEGTGSAGALAAVERHLAASEQNAGHWRELSTTLLQKLRAIP